MHREEWEERFARISEEQSEPEEKAGGHACRSRPEETMSESANQLTRRKKYHMHSKVTHYQVIQRKRGELACFVAGLAWGLHNETDEKFLGRCHTIERLTREMDNATSVLSEWKEQDRREASVLTEKNSRVLSETQSCLGDENA